MKEIGGWMGAFDFAAVIAAIIGAFVLFKTERIGYNERNQRAHWFFDDYIGAAGRHIECRTESTKADYYAWLFRYYIYADIFVEEKIKSVDDFIKAEKWKEAREELLSLAKYYKKQYSMSQYLPRKKKRCLHFD